MESVCIAGHGRLAKALLKGLEAAPFDGRKTRCILHAGSGREMRQVVAFCKAHKIPLIQASTGIEAPKNPPFAYIEAPNLAWPVLQFIEAATHFARSFEGGSITLTESHQAEKKTAAGTASLLAKQLQIDSFTSIRDPKEQKQRFQLEEKDLGRHAIHEIKIEVGGVEIRLESRVKGLEPYVAGAKELLKLDLESLQSGVYSIRELTAFKKSADNIATAN